MSTDPLVARVWDALARVNDPEVRRPITELGMVQSVDVREGIATITVLLTIVGCPASDRIERDIHAAVGSVEDVQEIDLTLGVMTPEQRAAFVREVRGDRADRPAQFQPDSLTRIIAVTSGKGGVGKSTVTAGLAVALAAQGLSVGLIDADVYGFSIPGILGLGADDRPTRVDDLILPPVAHNVKVISIGMFLRDEDAQHTAVAWRGPMLHRTIQQFLNDVWFGDLDVLLLDLPPGTGDVALTVGQLLPHAEVVVVTTPQPAAADVAVRSGYLAHQAGQRLLGVIENMSGLPQPDGSVLDLFGTGGGVAVADGLTALVRSSQNPTEQVPLIGKIPLSVTLRSAGDDGTPAVLTHPDDAASVALRQIAERLRQRPESLSGKSLPLRPT